MKDIITKIVKSFAYASAGGAIVAGTATINLVDADFATTAYMVIASVLFNAIRELLKSFAEKK